MSVEYASSSHFVYVKPPMGRPRNFDQLLYLQKHRGDNVFARLRDNSTRTYSQLRRSWCIESTH